MVLVDEVVYKDRCYYNSKPFSGIVFDVFENNGWLGGTDYNYGSFGFAIQSIFVEN